MSTTSNVFRFTKKAIESLTNNPSNSKSSDKEYTDTECPGFKVAVSKKGYKVFLFRYTFQGRKRAMKLGDFGAITVEQARKMAMHCRSQINQDQDPQAARDTQKLIPSFHNFAYNTYMPHSKTYKRSSKDDLSRLNAHLAPFFGARPLNAITYTDVQNYMNHLHTTCKLSPASLNRHRSLLSAIFILAIDRDLVTDNPCRKVKKRKESNMRDRCLSDDELNRLSQALEEIDPKTGDYVEKNRTVIDFVRLLLLTGMRREEALNAKWDHIDLSAKHWYLPQTKGGKPRYVPLSEQAVNYLASMKQKALSEWVFTNPKTGIRLVNPDKGFKRIKAQARIENLRIHDLRHTYASVAVSSGATLYQVQRLLGHASPQTTQRYAHLSPDTLRDVSNVVGERVRVA